MHDIFILRPHTTSYIDTTHCEVLGISSLDFKMTLYGGDLYKLAFMDPQLWKVFGGIYAADEHLPVWRDRQIFICNTDTHDNAGRHWTAYYFPDEGPSEYFDSKGRPPNYYGMAPAGIHNTVCLQGPQPVCGYYAMYYALLRCRGYSMESIVNSFETVPNNDDYVVTSVRDILHHVQPKTDRGCEL